LSEDKQSLLNKLSQIFDPKTAADFVCPKTYETRKHLTIDELKHGKNFSFDQGYINGDFEDQNL
jgi:hypothetical protein